MGQYCILNKYIFLFIGKVIRAKATFLRGYSTAGHQPLPVLSLKEDCDSTAKHEGSISMAAHDHLKRTHVLKEKRDFA